MNMAHMCYYATDIPRPYLFGSSRDWTLSKNNVGEQGGQEILVKKGAFVLQRARNDRSNLAAGLLRGISSGVLVLLFLV